jgi:serine phosphatase RsbU (regulator of sigma subunit)
VNSIIEFFIFDTHIQSHIKTVCYICIVFFSICLGIFGINTHAQWNHPARIDSLHSIFSTAPDDSSRIRIYNFLAWHHTNLDSEFSYDSTIYWVDRAIELMAKPENLHIYNFAYFHGAIAANKQNDQVKRVEYFLKYLAAARETGRKDWEGDALSELAKIFNDLKDLESAERYAAELELVIDEMGENQTKYNTLNNLGTYYKDLEKNELALATHEKALALAETLNLKQQISFSYNNIGLVYKNMQVFDKALEYYLKSIKLKEELNDVKGLAGSYINIAYIYNQLENYGQGMEFAKKGLAYAEQVNAISFKVVGLEHLFTAYLESGMYKDAALVSNDLVKQIKIKYDESIAEQSRDLERKYETEKNKKDLEIMKKEAELQELEIAGQRDSIRAQQRLIIVFAIGLAIVMLLSFILVRSLRERKKANVLLEKNFALIQEQKQKVESQKTILEQKNKEILDSINYAKRIQTALLPVEHQINQLLPENFILYMPKDIVAGDFYWIEEQNDSIYVAAADCTGHGVPGAMVSVICCNGLNKSLREYQLEKPDELLNKTRDEVITHFQKSQQSVNDGMDIGLIRIHKQENGKIKLEFAGAHNSLYIIRKNTKEIIEITGDKQPIGTYINMRPFIQHDIELSAGDSLYLLSDGYQDQFGGDHPEVIAKGGKKFKPSRLKSLLLSIHDKEMTEQKSILEKTFKEWKGQLEQVDDVCVIGVRL